MQGIYTVLRDRTSTRQDFIFFTDRLATLLVERAMEELPYREVAIETPVGVQSKGKTIDAEVCFPVFASCNLAGFSSNIFRAYVASASFVRKYYKPF